MVSPVHIVPVFGVARRNDEGSLRHAGHDPFWLFGAHPRDLLDEVVKKVEERRLVVLPIVETGDAVAIEVLAKAQAHFLAVGADDRVACHMEVVVHAVRLAMKAGRGGVFLGIYPEGDSNCSRTTHCVTSRKCLGG